jgi:hypothetical protein
MAGDWRFRVLDIAPTPYAAAPELTARLRIEEASGLQVHAIALRCQVRIEPQRRGYEQRDEAGLAALFGGRERWPDTLKPFQWMQCNTTVQGFTGSTDADLALPCTYDFDVTGARFLHAVEAGSLPLTLMFSGTVFTRGDNGFGVQQVPWDSEARYEMPVQVWRDMLATYFPRQGWIRLEHDVLTRLGDYRAQHGLVSWEETVTRLLTGTSAAPTRSAEVAP